MCIKLVKYRDKYTKMHGQRNVKILRHIFEKNTHIPNFVEICPVKTVFFLADISIGGRIYIQTDMTKLIFFSFLEFLELA